MATPAQPAELPEEIREIAMFYLDRPEEQREGFEDISALVSVLLAKCPERGP